MRLSRIFIDRPIFAAVIAVVITLVGAISYFGLPIAQYPEVVPPTITVSPPIPCVADTVADAVAAPIDAADQRRRRRLYCLAIRGDCRVTITRHFQGAPNQSGQVLVQ